MIIIEGPRKVGKSFTLETIQKYEPTTRVFKDLGIRILKDRIDLDDYAISRDTTYAQFLPQFMYLWDDIVFDRGYWSSYVYGQCWRNKYDKNFWIEHIKRVEDLYGTFLSKIKVLSFDLTEDDFKRIENTIRNKDGWENVSDYRLQYDLYKEVADISQVKKYFIKPFQSEEYIMKEFKILKII
jgi:hypothetical protein